MNPGFYSYDGVQVLYGPNFVIGPTFTLLKADAGTYSYPVNDWYWFDDQDSAYAFFGILP